jgi:hypothetical protein
MEEDCYQDEIGFSYGMIKQSGSGQLRFAQPDPKSKAKISQKLQVCFSSSFHLTLIYF